MYRIHGRTSKRVAMAIAGIGVVAFAGLSPASAGAQTQQPEFHFKYQSVAGNYTDCPLGTAPATPIHCLGYAINARSIQEEVGGQEYKDQLVWVDVVDVTLGSSGIPTIGALLFTSRGAPVPPTYGGTPAEVDITGASSGRVKGTAIVHAVTGSATKRVKLNMLVNGGATFVDAGSTTTDGSYLCPSGTATATFRGVVNTTAQSGGTVVVDGTTLVAAPAFAFPGFLQTYNDEGVCNP